MSIALKRSLASAIHARFLGLEESMTLLPPPLHPRSYILLLVLGGAIVSVVLHVDSILAHLYEDGNLIIFHKT